LVEIAFAAVFAVGFAISSTVHALPRSQEVLAGADNLEPGVLNVVEYDVGWVNGESC